MLTEQRLLAMSEPELGGIDPVVMNLTIAKGIPALAQLDIPRFVRMADGWAADLRKVLPAWEKEFRQSPKDWANCIHLFRLGAVATYIDRDLGIKYVEDQAAAIQAGVREVLYTDPGDLFLNKVMETRRGTCGNMAMLHVVLGRRLGWPVSLTTIWSHYLLRFDNGKVVWNVEASDTGRGGFSCRPDPYFIDLYKIDPEHVRSGSDLAFLTPRQMLGCFFDLRARHYNNTDRDKESLADSERAIACFPQSRYVRRNYEGARRNLQRGGFGTTVMIGPGY